MSGSTVYAGGAFTSIGGQARSHIAALDATTGAATAWNPNANGVAVYALAVSGSTVYAGGQLHQHRRAGAQPHRRARCHDRGGHRLGPERQRHVVSRPGGERLHRLRGRELHQHRRAGAQPHRRARCHDRGGHRLEPERQRRRLRALAVSGSTVYAGGCFTSIGGQARNYIAALDATTGAATAWNPNASGYVVSALAVSGSTVYAGGSASPASAGRRAAASPRSMPRPGRPPPGTLNANGSAVSRPGGERLHRLRGRGLHQHRRAGAQPHRRARCHDRGGHRAGTRTPDGVVSALAVSGSTVYAGGYFSSIGGLAAELPRSHG